MKVLLGYEMGTGEEVHVPLAHTIVTGLTQLSGKTTTLEALIVRSGRRSIAFRTKRGEANFDPRTTHRHEPFFREKADWQYVAALLEATMRERMKFERPWIIKVSKRARTLQDVLDNVTTELETARGLAESVYTTLKAYLEIVVPEIKRISFAKKLDLQPGLNVMDLVGLREEVQALIIASTIEEVHAHYKGTLTVLPEAWKFLPEGRGSPVKRSAESIAREGAGIENFLLLDSQDITGVDKAPLKNVSVWILGRQQEKNEVQRVIDQISLPKSKRPKTDEIMSLDVGCFVVCVGSVVRKVYVRPAWLSEKLAKHIAVTGNVRLASEMRPEVEEEPEPEVRSDPGELPDPPENDNVPPNKNADAERVAQLQDELDRLRASIVSSEKQEKKAKKADKAAKKVPPAAVPPEEAVRYSVGVEVRTPSLTLHERIVRVQMDGSDDKGRIAILIAEGFFDSQKAVAVACREMEARGWGKWGGGGGASWTKMQRLLTEFATMGFLRNVSKEFVLVPDAKKRITRKKTTDDS